MKEKPSNLQNVKQLPSLSLRFLEVLDENNLTGYRLKKDKTSITPSKLTHIKNGRNKVTDDLIEALLKYIPHLSKVWLLTGVGEKYNDIIKKKHSSEGNDADNSVPGIRNKPYDEQIQMLYNEIKELRNDKIKDREEIEHLKDVIDDLSLTIEISLAPILRHFKLKKDENKRDKHNNSSIN